MRIGRHWVQYMMLGILGLQIACQTARKADGGTTSSTSDRGSILQSAFGQTLDEQKTVAICVTWQGETPFAVLRINYENGALVGPSLGHEDHITGKVWGVRKFPEANDQVETKVFLEQGKVRRVAGEDGQAEQMIGSVSLMSILDDSAAREFRNRVVLETNNGQNTLYNCAFGRGVGKLVAASPDPANVSNSGRSNNAEQSFGKLLEKSTTVAVCVSWEGDDPMPALRLNFQGTAFAGPSLGHEPHVRGTLVRATQRPESGDTAGLRVEMEGGQLVEVAGEGNGPLTRVRGIEFQSLLDDSANREFRNRIILDTDREPRQFDHCRFGAGLGAVYRAAGSK